MNAVSSDRKKPLGFGLIFLGLCFFANPYIAVIDIFPDFIGALLIALGLLPFQRLCAPLREAQKAFLYLAAIDVLKMLLLIFTFGGSAMGEQEVLILIIAFLGATLGTLFTVLAVRKLFDGIDTLAVFHNCEALYSVTRGRRSRTERMASFATVFIVFKEILLLLPEFAALLNSTYVDSSLVRLYDYIGVMRLLVIVPAFIAGIVYLIVLAGYFRRVKRERAFRVALSVRYDDFMRVHPGIRIKARMAIALAFLGVGACLLTDFYIDLQNIFPDVLAGVCILVGILLLRLPLKQMGAALIAGCAYGGCALLSTVKSYLFVSEHVGADINRSEAVANEYLVMWISAFAEFLVFLALLICLLFVLRRLLLTWGYYMPEHTDEGFEQRHYRRMRDEFDWQFIKCGILGAISALLSFLYDYFQTWPDKKIFRLMEALWIPDFIFGIVFGAYFCYTLALVMQKIKQRFEFE